eukprot:2206994-Amphidinium_carterae.1
MTYETSESSESSEVFLEKLVTVSFVAKLQATDSHPPVDETLMKELFTEFAAWRLRGTSGMTEALNDAGLGDSATVIDHDLGELTRVGEVIRPLWARVPSASQPRTTKAALTALELAQAYKREIEEMMKQDVDIGAIPEA